jgi:hypothetical protein
LLSRKVKDVAQKHNKPLLSGQVSEVIGKQTLSTVLFRHMALVYDKSKLSRLAGANKSFSRGNGLDFDHIRPYASGDSARLIDWKSFARTRHAYTRVNVEDRQLKINIICYTDSDVSAMLYEDEAVTDIGYRIVSNIVQLGHVNKDKVRVITLDSDSIRSSRYTTNLLELDKTLVNSINKSLKNYAEPSNSQTNKLLGNIKSGELVVIIGIFDSPEKLGNDLNLQLISKKNNVYIINLVKSMPLWIGSQSFIHFETPSAKGDYIGTERIKKQWISSCQTNSDVLAAECKKLNIRYVAPNSTDSHLTLTRKLLGATL